ncbi:MAG TPA: 1-phosphofructokinase family hexose kinase [Acidimicrobiales bacterium]
MSARVLTVTANAAIDHTVWVPGFRAGEVNRVVAEDRSPGGKGVNVAAALRVLGVEVDATGFLGTGNASLFEAFFADAGIGDRFVRLDGVTRTGIKIVDEQAGTTTDVNFPGIAPGAGDVARLLEVVGELSRSAAWVALSGSLPAGAPVDLYARLIEAAHGGGAEVALDTSGKALGAAVAAGPDLVKPNVEELEALVRRPLPDTGALLGAVADLQAGGVARVVVSMGAEGGLFVAGDEAVVARPPRVAVVSTVGAGDATVAGTLAATLAGGSLEDVARLAMACGATAVTGVGPRLDAGEVAARAGEVRVETLGVRSGSKQRGTPA